LYQRALPASKFTIRIISTTIKHASLSSTTLDKFAAIFGAIHTDLLQPRFRISAGGEIRAAYEFAIAPVPYHKRLTTIRAYAIDYLRLHFQLGH
jgi:hypothetical protein